MTQAAQVETCSVSTPIARGEVVQSNVPNATADSCLFAQLLAIAQNLTVPAGQEPPAALPADGPPPPQQEAPSAEEMAQIVASLGLPAPSLPMPVANAPGVETPLLSARIALLQPIATDAPLPAYSPVGAEPAQAEAFALHDRTSRTPLAGESADLPTLDQQVSATREPVQPAIETATAVPPPSGEKMPASLPDLMHAPERESPALPASETQRLPQNATEKVQTPSEVSATATAAPASVASAAQTGSMEQPQGEGKREHQNTAQTAPASVRTRAKRSAIFTNAERSSPTQPTEAPLHPLQGVHTASTVHRPQEAMPQPREVSPAEVVRQVAQQVESMVSNHRASSVTLQLEPEHLGRLRVTISLNDGAIHTHIVADNHAVRQMLESNSALLQQALQERGLQLGALQVSVQGDSRQFLWHQPYTPPPSAMGWLEAEAVWNTAEASLGRTTPGGINLLV
ncbi:MAG: hypothetical protein KatS3mg023_2296 [Armatimonadota bacterium]|nr:MAG: hypothetical protein KatS3mg023_2296 [Armatimonadota bacterium]